jgi:hypothetical protein
MKKKTLKKIGLLILAGIVLAIGVATYLFFKPHRNVQAMDAFATLTAKALTDEFTVNASAANAKYLASDGNSKVLIVKGLVSKISENQNGEKVIILKGNGAKVGVGCTFTKQTSANTTGIKLGDEIEIKGAITAGNRYDADLDLYENAVLVQCDIVK